MATFCAMLTREGWVDGWKSRHNSYGISFRLAAKSIFAAVVINTATLLVQYVLVRAMRKGARQLNILLGVHLQEPL